VPVDTDTAPLVVKAEGRRKSVPSEIGATGLRQYGGYVVEEYLPQLAGDQAPHVYKEMGHDPVVAGMLLALGNLYRKVEWTVDPSESAPEGSEEAQKMVEFVEQCLHDMSASLPETMAKVATKFQYGWSWLETVYKQRLGPQPDRPGALPSSKYSDGLFGWRKWAIRGQDSKMRWEFDESGGVQGLWQTLITGTVMVPIAVSLHFKTGGEKDNPEGHAILRAAYRPYYLKRRMEEVEAIGIERDAAGLPVAYVPGAYLAEDATDEEKAVVAALESIVQGIRRNEKEGLVLPRDYDEDGNPIFGLELLASAGSRQIDIDQVINRHNAEIALCALADWLLIGHERVGARNLADSKIDLFMTALETWSMSDAAVINAHAIPRLFDMNGFDLNMCPTVRPSRVKQVDVKEFADTLAVLLNSGAIVPDADLEDHVREIADLPPRAQDNMGAGQTPPPDAKNRNNGGPNQMPPDPNAQPSDWNAPQTSGQPDTLNPWDSAGRMFG